MMERVGHRLQRIAIENASDAERDVFGRSAYNRYYYAAFLRARTMLIRLNPDQWGNFPHGSYPDLLAGSIRKRIRKGLEQARRINDAESISNFSRALDASRQLSELMKSAYTVRVVADYNPEVAVTFVAGGRFSLNNVDITAAHDWVEKTDVWASAIESAWRQIDA